MIKFKYLVKIVLNSIPLILILNGLLCWSIFKLQSQRNEPLRAASPIYDSDHENDLPFDIESGPINSPPERGLNRNEMATPRSASASPRNSQRKVFKYRVSLINILP